MYIQMQSYMIWLHKYIVPYKQYVKKLIWEMAVLWIILVIDSSLYL